MDDNNITLEDIFSSLSKLNDFKLKNAYFALYDWICENESGVIRYTRIPVGICTFDSPIINLYSERLIAKWNVKQKADPLPWSLLNRTHFCNEDISCVEVVFENVEGERSHE